MNKNEYKYQKTNFWLNLDIIDFDMYKEANNYLQSDDMTIYLKDDIQREIDKADKSGATNEVNKFKKLYNKIKHIEWCLSQNLNEEEIKNINDKNKIKETIGIITILTNDILNNFEQNFISIFIMNQNSDGLGEGFSQQDFANIFLEDNNVNNSEKSESTITHIQYRIISKDLKGKINKYKLKLVNWFNNS